MKEKKNNNNEKNHAYIIATLMNIDIKVEIRDMVDFLTAYVSRYSTLK